MELLRNEPAAAGSLGGRQRDLPLMVGRPSYTRDTLAVALTAGSGRICAVIKVKERSE